MAAGRGVATRRQEGERPQKAKIRGSVLILLTMGRLELFLNWRVTSSSIYFRKIWNEIGEMSDLRER